jgi:hypothetical protein
VRKKYQRKERKSNHKLEIVRGPSRNWIVPTRLPNRDRAERTNSSDRAARA